MSGQSPLDTRLASLGLIFGALVVGYWYYRGAGAAAALAPAPAAPGPSLPPAGTLPPSAYTVPDSTIDPSGGIPPYLQPYAPTLVVPRSSP